MKVLFVTASLLMSPIVAQAATITEYGTLTSGSPTTENGFVLRYSFAPLAIPGQITDVQLDFTGFISARIGGASDLDIATGNTITSVTVTPMASFATSLISGPAVPTNPSAASFTGTPVTEAYNNASNVSVSPSAQAVTLTSNAPFAFPFDTFATPLPAAVALNARPFPISIVEPPGSTANFPGGPSYDRTTGTGTLLLTVTYTPIPEPASLSLLALALLCSLPLARRLPSP